MMPASPGGLPPIDYDALDPGIRETVRWLRRNAFDTTGSAEGDESTEPFVLLNTLVSPAAFADAARLVDVLRARGIEPPSGMVTLTYDPVDNLALIMLEGVDDEMLAQHPDPEPEQPEQPSEPEEPEPPPIPPLPPPPEALPAPPGDEPAANTDEPAANNDDEPTQA